MVYLGVMHAQSRWDESAEEKQLHDEVGALLQLGDNSAIGMLTHDRGRRLQVLHHDVTMALLRCPWHYHGHQLAGCHTASLRLQ